MTADLERTQILYTSLLIQSTHGLATTPISPGDDIRALRRTWLAGFAGAVHNRLTAIETAARHDAQAEDTVIGGPATTLVLASSDFPVPELTDGAVRRPTAAPAWSTSNAPSSPP
ncbi:hypothetical protein [Frankia sp. R43]|uniref:hypothetical protein n=1 Tax=Frankia sp. R43 TaxID=269536 RepID=UPI0009FA5BB6|nr:hypothetical protein [Frankia sp. R43]